MKKRKEQVERPVEKPRVKYDEVKPDGEKLQKVLARLGLGSRRKLEESIQAGEIRVNGKVAKLGDRVVTADKIKIKGHPVVLDDKIEKKNPAFFKIPVYLPYNSPVGKYEIMMEVFNAGKVVQKKKKNLTVLKPGFNSFVYSFAHNFSFLYGLLCAIVAIALGLTAGYVFRR